MFCTFDPVRYCWFLFLVFVLLSSPALSTLEPYFQIIRKEQGLPTNTIYAVSEDQHGRILLTTEKGLYRYNGIQFKEIPCKQNTYKSLANLRKVDGSTFLAHNFNGQVFLLKEDRLSLLKLSCLPAEINNIRVNGDSLLVISLRKIQLYNWRKRVLISTIRSSQQTIHFFTAQFTRKGIAYTMTDGTLYYDHRKYVLFRNMCYDMEESDQQVIFTPIYGKNFPVYVIRNQRLVEIGKLPFNENPKLYTTTAINGNTYICAQNGIIQIQPNGTIKRWFNGYQTTRILKDKRNNFWVSTLNQGLLYIPNIRAVKLCTEPVISVQALSDSQLFTGNAFGAVYQLSEEGLLMQKYLPKLSLTEASFIDLDGNYLRTPTSVFAIHSGKQLNTRFEYTKHLAKDKQGNIYLAKTYGLLCIEKKNIREPGSEYGQVQASRIHYLRSVRTKNVIVCPDQTVVASCIDGVYYWKKGIRRELRYQGKRIKASWLTFYGNKLYVSTNEHGVLVFRNFRFEEQLISGTTENFGKVIKCVVHPFGVYILTDMNLYLRKTGQTECKAMKQSLGFKDIEINDLTLTGRFCYLATDVGVIRVPITDFPDEKPQLLVHQLEINDQTFPYQRSFQIESGDNDLKILIEPIAFKNSSFAQIEYQLINSSGNNKWITIPMSSNSIYLSSLKPGDYLLNIRISNGEHIPSGSIQQIHFTILNPWYFQWYAVVFYIGLIAGIISFFWWLRSNYLKRKYDRELQQQRLSSELAEARLTALRAQMNPHFMYNVLNSIQSLVYADKHNEASYYLGKFADLTRRFLELSSREQVTIKQECETLQIYLELEKMRFGDEFTYSIDVDPAIDPTFQEIPTLLLQPFVENSLKHGLLHKEGKKHLELQFRSKKQSLEIIIRDNGIGRVHADKINQRNKESKTSYATDAVKRKLELLNRTKQEKILLEITDLQDENFMPTGTEVKLIIPLEHEMHTH
jgi:sensor histidine kinase YesM